MQPESMRMTLWPQRARLGKVRTPLASWHIRHPVRLTHLLLWSDQNFRHQCECMLAHVPLVEAWFVCLHLWLLPAEVCVCVWGGRRGNAVGPRRTNSVGFHRASQPARVLSGHRSSSETTWRRGEMKPDVPHWPRRQHTGN
ncbi:hypothetical protein LX36DRAFT_15903 [Colletotrichum falcatum]|nr:hypothetical protein LX36DRAFT_15903 [Colletotrichum falcatum]